MNMNNRAKFSKILLAWGIVFALTVPNVSLFAEVGDNLNDTYNAICSYWTPDGYVTGDYVYYNGAVWKCIAEEHSTPEAFVEGEWQKATVMTFIANLDTKVADHEARLKTAEETIADHENRLTTAEETIAEHGETLDNHGERIAQNENDIAELKSKLTTYRINKLTIYPTLGEVSGYLGEYDAYTCYNPGDIVSYNNVLYECKNESTLVSGGTTTTNEETGETTTEPEYYGEFNSSDWTTSKYSYWVDNGNGTHSAYIYNKHFTNDVAMDIYYKKGTDIKPNYIDNRVDSENVLEIQIEEPPVQVGINYILIYKEN